VSVSYLLFSLSSEPGVSMSTGWFGGFVLAGGKFLPMNTKPELPENTPAEGNVTLQPLRAVLLIMTRTGVTPITGVLVETGKNGKVPRVYGTWGISIMGTIRPASLATSASTFTDTTLAMRSTGSSLKSMKP